ncbi:WD domain containing protein [Metarhizium album ARSEF 1941]|uniref:WD domain containing protein n=1 Tax=Metarhizium album (strain ARSEF 1941) TaxID=1081103 RepID=A0A0B2WXK6_METAS|nr:WD domain containing protein [Metarhizium album ARSEF 1941]KHN98299.1 WD domain containing protein [Metarhizium album ARSEF 1941]
MAAIATPSNNRLKLTPSNSPLLSRPSRFLIRGRSMHESRLSLRRVVGTTCRSPTGFDTVNSSFAYIAGGAVVVVDVDGQLYSQRFYRARPTAVPMYSVSSSQNAPSTPISTTPKANDSRNRVAPNCKDSGYSPVDWAADSSSGPKTWTSRERIKAATCIALSPDGRYLAVGETGYAPRVLIFSLLDASSDTPLVSISEHAFGVTAVAWSEDSKYLASLGAANDGFLFVWKIDPRTGAAKLFQQNRCTSYIRDMVWMGNSLITLGVRHVKAWKIEDGTMISPPKAKVLGDTTPSTSTPQKTLPGRNMLLGSLLEATFSCAAVDGKSLIFGTETGDVCILDDDDRQMKLTKVLNLEFAITTITIRGKVVYVGGKDGHFATLDVERVMGGCAASVLTTSQTSAGVVALGFLPDKLVTIDSKQSIDVWNPDCLPGQDTETAAHIPIPGHGEPIIGVHSLHRPNKANAAFVTWSASGNVTFWDVDGQVKLTLDVPVEDSDPDNEATLPNQLTSARTTKSGKLLVTADRQGIVKVVDVDSKDCLLDIKAHSSDCLCISIYDEESKFLMACCGRDRTAQLFHRDSTGRIEHFQTLEFAAKVIQVLIPADDKVITCSLDPIPSKVISLKSSPTSMTMSPDNRTIFVSSLDRSIYQYDLASGRQLCCFKCMDEGGVEAVVLDSLFVGQWPSKDVGFLLGSSNTDKSIRLYDANSGAFLDREWGHTEAINGVSLVEDDDGTRKVVSVGSDGTIMVWTLDLNDPSPRSMSRDPSPVKEAINVGSRPTLRKVLSKADLAEFQRHSPSPAGRRSPPRSVRRRTSRVNLGAAPSANRTPVGNLAASPSDSAISEDTPSRRGPWEINRGDSPPASPKSRVSRTPSMPALSAVAKRKSLSNLRGPGSLNTATEQACRTLRSYRKKLSSAEPITAEGLTELDQELRLTAVALGDRAIRSNAINETVLSGLLDQYSERLVTLLDEKLRLTNQLPKNQEMDTASSDDRPRSADGSSSSSSP